MTLLRNNDADTVGNSGCDPTYDARGSKSRPLGSGIGSLECKYDVLLVVSVSRMYFLQFKCRLGATGGMLVPHGSGIENQMPSQRGAGKYTEKVICYVCYTDTEVTLGKNELRPLCTAI